MATGYTYNIAKGQGFEDFALGCAQAFIPHMKEDRAGTPIYLARLEPYYETSLAEAKEYLSSLQAMSAKEIESATAAYNDEHKRNADKGAEERRELQAKYEQMLAQVEAYEPPSELHSRYKGFMREQIQESIRFDCWGSFGGIKELTAEEWYSVRVKSAVDDVAYREEALAKEIKRVAGLNEWINQLLVSLGKEPLA